MRRSFAYLRNTQGGVVARQLIGVSEDEQRVCFEVYPVHVSGEIRRLFRDFDVELAARLGLEIHQPGDETGPSGKIERLLSGEWRDDGAGDWEADAEEAGEALEVR